MVSLDGYANQLFSAMMLVMSTSKALLSHAYTPTNGKLCRSAAIHTIPPRSSSCVRLAFSVSTVNNDSNTGSALPDKGKLLVLGGTGYLGQTVCQKAVLEGYSVVSLSRRGRPNTNDQDRSFQSPKIEYRQGDARQLSVVQDIMNPNDNFCGVIHCIGLLFDDASGLGSYNRFVSGSGSLPDRESTYDTITRLTAFNAIECATNYAQARQLAQPLPFCFTSAAEAGWPDVTGGTLIEGIMPDFIQRYMVAKRAVEAKLMASEPILRPIIVRPSLIYSMDRPASLPSVGVFTLFNKIGLPFVDRPVTVRALASTMVRAMGRDSVKGVLRYPQIDEMSS
jgi:nucleoside-diphosphate-sugar epimerase